MQVSRPLWRKTPLRAALVAALSVATLASLPVQAQQNGTPMTQAPAAVLPGDDFYGYVNGEWMRTTEIPADRSSWGSFASLAEQTNARITALVEALPKNAKAGTEAAQIGDFYRSYMDEAAIEAKGWAPVKPLLKKSTSCMTRPAWRAPWARACAPMSIRSTPPTSLPKTCLACGWRRI